MLGAIFRPGVGVALSKYCALAITLAMLVRRLAYWFDGAWWRRLVPTADGARLGKPRTLAVGVAHPARPGHSQFAVLPGVICVGAAHFNAFDNARAYFTLK